MDQQKIIMQEKKSKVIKKCEQEKKIQCENKKKKK